MVEKSRPFSIYLLKPGYDATSSLVDDHGLREVIHADRLPEGATIYILDAQHKRPWWREYFGVQDDIWQEFKGALVFLPINDRCFALSFGQVYHHLKETAYEYDFGLRVTLNMLDPNELRSADMVEPGPARRKRTQVPVSTELTYLDFDGNREIIKALTGKVKPEYEELFKNATGSSSLKLSLKLAPGELPARCAALLDLYTSENYKTAFPNIQNITPVKDPDAIRQLDGMLLASLRNKDGATTLAIPDIVDYRDNTCCMFSGQGRESDIYPDITIEKFYEFLGAGFDFQALSTHDLKTFRMSPTDPDGSIGRSYSIYRSVIFEVEPPDQGVVYDLCDGDWYKIEKAFVDRLKRYLDAKCENADLAAYNHDVARDGKLIYSEETYNSAIPVLQSQFICLDQTNISPSGNTEVEPCDLYVARPDESAQSGCRGCFYHIKISTRSAHLSHLFNQGINAAELVQLEEASRDKMKALIVERLRGNDEAVYLAPFQHYDFKIIFAVITHKGAAGLSSNLPLFSRLSLMRIMQRLDLMRTPSALMFVPDNSVAKGGHSKFSMYLVEVRNGAVGKEVHAVAGQDVDPNIPIRRCPREVRDSEVGTRYKLSVKKQQDGSLSSHHGWPFTIAA